MPAIRPKGIPQALIDALRYEGGALYWKEARRGGAKAGAKATHNSEGYNIINWDYKTWRASRVIWAMHHGDTSLVIDHINRDKGDDRIENLRAVTHAFNCANRNTGVSFNKRLQKWQARWAMENLGLFDNALDAWAKRKSEENNRAYC